MSKTGWSIWNRSRIQLLSIPELGASRKIHAFAPRNDGVTNAARISGRNSRRPGMSVRETNQARGVPTATAINPTAKAILKELTIGSRREGWGKAERWLSWVRSGVT